MNEYFVRSEVEYQRQQRLSAAASHRRARSARRVRTIRARVSAAVDQFRGHGVSRREAGTPSAA